MKNLYLLFAFCFFSIGYAQNPADIDLNYNYNDNVAKFYTSTHFNHVLDSNGRVLVFGYSSHKLYNDQQSIVIDAQKVNRLENNLLFDKSFESGTFKEAYSNNSEGNSTPRAVATQPDGKILVAGRFFKYNGASVNKIIRLNSNGTLDDSFDFYTDVYSVNAITVLANGKILIAYSNFESVNNHPYLNTYGMKLLNSDGSTNTDFNINSSMNAVQMIRQTDGKIIALVKYLSGSSNPLYAPRITVQRFNSNGTLDTAFNVLDNNYSNATMYGFNGFSDDSIDSENSYVNKIALQNDGKILVGGSGIFNNTPVHGLVRLNSNGSHDATFVNQTSVGDFSLLSDNTILVTDGIEFKKLLPNGSIDASFTPARPFSANTLIKNFSVLGNGEILVKGRIDVSRYDPVTNSTSHDIFYKFYKLDNLGNLIHNQQNNTFYQGNVIIKKSGNENVILGKIQDRGNLKYHDGLKFINNNGELLHINPGNLYNFNSNDFEKEIVNGVIQSDGKIIVQTKRKLTANSSNYTTSMIRLNADYTIDSSYNSPFADAYYYGVFLMNLQSDDKLILGGTRYNIDGTVDNTFQTGVTNGGVYCSLIQPDGKILIGGAFTTYNGLTARKIVRVNSDGTLDPSFTSLPDGVITGTIYSICLQSDNKILIGGDLKNNFNLTSLQMIRLNSDGSKDMTFTDFNDNFNYAIKKIIVNSNDEIYTLSQSVTLNGQLKGMHANGVLDTAFNTGTGFTGKVNSMVLQQNGGILVVGDFTRYNGAWCNGSVCLLGGNGYVISGQNKIDYNTNGCDINDLNFPNLKIKIATNNNLQDYIANTTGNFSIGLAAGSYTLLPVIENPAYFSVSPSSVTVDFPTQASPFTQNFCITPSGVHPDLEVVLLPVGIARPGVDAKYKLVYKNKGNQIQSGTVSLNFDDAVLDFVSATPAASTQATNVRSWNFSNLKPFETKEITITLNLNSPTETPALTAGNVLNYTAAVTSAQTDETSGDNTFVFKQTIVNSFDPNDKTCLEGTTVGTDKVGEYVHYVIRFENTGTYAAQNINVTDIIDINKFDVNSLIPLRGSHLFTAKITTGNKVEFKFENINLPFAAGTNTGYVAFKIKTKSTLAVGDTFGGNAAIYFDYNSAITTNTYTTVIQALNVKDFSFGNYFSLYPNPVSDVLHISKKESITISSVNIYNTLGQLVIVIPNAKDIASIDVSHLAAGNYFVKINSDKGTSNTKFIKQ